MKATTLQLSMHHAVGHKVKVSFVDQRDPWIGRCTGFTPPYDNEPEIAAINFQFEDQHGSYELTEEEIKSIEILD